MNRPCFSQQRYLAFVRDYKHRRLDEATEARENRQQHQDPAEAAAAAMMRPTLRPKTPRGAPMLTSSL